MTEEKLTISCVLAACLLAAFGMQKCNEHGAQELKARTECVRAGHTPQECGLVRVER